MNRIKERAKEQLSRLKSGWNCRYKAKISWLDRGCKAILGHDLETLSTNILCFLAILSVGLLAAVVFWVAREAVIPDITFKIRIYLYLMYAMAIAEIGFMLAVEINWIAELNGIYWPKFWAAPQKAKIKSIARHLLHIGHNSKQPRKLWC